MKNKFLFSAIGMAALALAMNACQETSVKPSSDISSQEVTKPSKFIGAGNLTDCKLKKDITYSLKNWELNWVKDTVYCLCGDVRVPATKQLNIAAGTLVRGIKESASSLTVVAGAKIHAVGLANDPIIFTSSQTVGSRAPQDWGGVIILGNAQVNQTAPIAIEGFPAAGSPAGAAGPPTYGSNTTANNGESSGEFQYVRIEFGGVALPAVANSEKNGLTLGGVGSGTTIDHVQTSSGQDDGFEWFGGTVNAKYLISHKNLDDDFDTDFGFQGKVQFGVVSRDPNRADASKSNGFESDNDGTGSTATPRTSAIFSNFTIIGPLQCSNTINANYQDGLHIRRRSGIDVYNSIITGWPRNQVFADATISSSNVAPSNAAVLSYNRAVAPLAAAAPQPLIVTEPAAPNNVWTIGPSNTSATVSSTNCSSATAADGLYRLSGLQTSAWTLTAVNFTPLQALGYTSPLLSAGTNASAIDPFFTANLTSGSNYFIGARRVADDNGWGLSSGWVNWQPETLSYPNDGLY